MRAVVVLCVLLAGIGHDFRFAALYAEPFPKDLMQADPEAIGMLSSHLVNIDSAMEAAIQAGEIPGGVVLVARNGRIAYFKAFGNKSIQPQQEPMTTDTIFDIASMTKVMATAPAVMLLVENGTLRLDDKVKRYLPNFAGGGKDGVTLRHCLTHYSGLPADFDLSKPWFGYAEALEELWKIKTTSEPGKVFAYSDLNYVALGEVIQVASGKTLDAFAAERIFAPLGMSVTGFSPPEALRQRIAPTESRRNTLRYLKGNASLSSLDQVLRGEVHDPTAWRMGGVAGHAGLFSSAGDIAIFAQMMLDRGIYPGGRFLSSMSIQAMTRPQSPASAPDVRGYGWDLQSDYSSPRGDILEGGYGHTGFTGTSIWIHPPTDTFVILLTNRVHPDGGKDINHIRGAVANIVAAAITDSR